MKLSQAAAAFALAVAAATNAFAQNTEAREPFVFTEVDLKLLEQVDHLDAKLERDGLILSDAQINELLTRVGNAVVGDTAPLERVAWRFRAIRDATPNAFALPNGSIMVHTGLLSILDNEHQLASVLAHEVTHVRDRHSYKAFRDYRKKAVAANFLNFASGMVPGSSAWGLAVSVIASTVPIILSATVDGYSRELERDADLYAVDTLIGAGYDPMEMVNTFRLLSASSELEAERLFYTDHPKLQQRIADITTVVDARGTPRVATDEIAALRGRYLGFVGPAVRQNVALAIASGRFRSAVAAARRLDTTTPATTGQHAYWIAEAHRALGPRTAEPTKDELTEKGRKESQRRKERMTLQEEEKALLGTQAGRAAWEQNRRDAEAWYRRALEADPPAHEAYRGLGLLLQDDRPGEAIEVFTHYIEQVPDARDRSQILRRLEVLRQTPSRGSTGTPK